MTTSPETTVLRGQSADRVPRARVDTELRTSHYLRGSKSDPRLLDPDLERAFGEASQIVRAAAQAEGFAAGYADGRTRAAAEVRSELEFELAALAEAESRREASHSTLFASLTKVLNELEARIVPTYEEVADQLGAAAYRIVETIMGRELVLSKDLVLDAARRACAIAPRGADLTLWLSAADASSIESVDLASIIGRPVRLLVDSSLNSGDARAESGATRIDARLATALTRVKEMLEA